MNIKLRKSYPQDFSSYPNPSKLYVYYLLLVSLSSLPSSLCAGPIQNFIHKNNPSYTNKSVIQDHDWNGHEGACSSHTTCSECTSSELFCHWCSSDQSCHSTKHWTEYSCVIGITDCSAAENNSTYGSNMEQAVASLSSSSSSSSSNNQCQRNEPEKLTNLYDDRSRVSWITFLYILSFFVFSIAILKFKSFSFPKNLFSSKTERFMKVQNKDEDDLTLQVEHDADEENDAIELTDINHFSIDDDDDDDDDDVGVGSGIDTKESMRQNETMEQPQEQENSSLQSCWHRIVENIIVCLCTGRAASTKFRWLRIMLIAIAFIICSIGIIALQLNPKIPKVNICSTRVGWTNLLKNLANRNLVATFDILFSVENQNKIDVSLDLSHGSIQYDGVELATFEINSLLLQAESITDDLVSVNISTPFLKSLSNDGEMSSSNHIHPKELMQEMISGELFFTAESDIGVSFPNLLGYSYTGKWKEYRINFWEEVSAVSTAIKEDRFRELCVCKFLE